MKNTEKLYKKLDEMEFKYDDFSKKFTRYTYLLIILLTVVSVLAMI